MSILINQVLHRVRITPAFFQEKGTEQVEICNPGIERLAPRRMAQEYTPRLQAPSATALEVPAGDFLNCKPRRAEGVREGLERYAGEHLAERLLVFEDCLFVDVGRRVPGMTV